MTVNLNQKSSDDERASRPIDDSLTKWLKPKPRIKEYDMFKGYREPDYLERRWEPEEL